MARWDRPGIPHKGWNYIGIEDFGEDALPGEEIPYEQCEMCGNEKIRYVHILTHPEFNGEIRVGCSCAAKMMENYSDLEKMNEDCGIEQTAEKTFCVKSGDGQKKDSL